MRRFIDTINKEILVVVEEMDFADNFACKLNSQGVYVVTNEYPSYSSGAFGDIYSAVMDIINSAGKMEYYDYFVQPSKEKLKEVWSRYNHNQKNKPYDEKLARNFYYEDCLSEVLTDDDHDFLQWLTNKNKVFTYITVTDGWDFVDLIEYHPHRKKNKLLADIDYLEKVFFNEWYTLVTEDFRVEKEKFNLNNESELTQYMLNKYHSVEIPEIDIKKVGE